MTLMNYFEKNNMSFEEVMKLYKNSKIKTLNDFLNLDIDKIVPLFDDCDLIIDESGLVYVVKSFNVDCHHYELKLILRIEEGINGLTIHQIRDEKYITEEQLTCECRCKCICEKVRLLDTLASFNKENKNEQ